MTQGTVTKLVHLANQRDLPTTNLTSQQNFTGYGYIESKGRELVYFKHSVVSGRSFNDLEEGDRVEFEVDAQEQNTAVSVQVQE